MQRRAELRVLRRMDVKLHEAGEQEASRGQFYEASLRLRFAKRDGVVWIVGPEDRGDPPCTINADQGVLDSIDRPGGRRVKERAEQRFVPNVIHRFTASY